MGKFEVGDKYKVLDDDHGKFKSGEIVTIVRDDGDTVPLVTNGNVTNYLMERELELIEDKTMKYEVGQILEKDNREYTQEIIANFEDKVLVLLASDGIAPTLSVEHLERDGWHIKDQSTTTELTVKEIEEKLGVKNLKVVKKKKYWYENH